MTMENKFRGMLALQERLNTNTNGERWKEGINNSGRTINWIRCIWMEAAEAADSFRWKHWKDVAGGVDIDNLRVEIVDIWHFVMSEVLRQAHLDSFPYSEETKVSQEAGEEYLLEKAAKSFAATFIPEKVGLTDGADLTDFDIDLFVGLIEDFVTKAMVCRERPSYESAIELAGGFLWLAGKLGVSGDDLYEGYIGKNILNQFRQDHGYKEGTYNKEGWGESGDQEDNVVLKQIMRENPSISPDELYAELEKAYPGSMERREMGI
jgi:dimeric dUTPase (all-alpha-NTP-PPase superfamily)